MLLPYLGKHEIQQKKKARGHKNAIRNNKDIKKRNLTNSTLRDPFSKSTSQTRKTQYTDFHYILFQILNKSNKLKKESPNLSPITKSQSKKRRKDHDMAHSITHTKDIRTSLSKSNPSSHANLILDKKSIISARTEQCATRSTSINSISKHINAITSNVFHMANTNLYHISACIQTSICLISQRIWTFFQQPQKQGQKEPIYSLYF